MGRNLLLMAVDLGTSFIKAGVYDLDGRQRIVEKEAVKSSRPGPGQFIQRGDDLMASVCKCIRLAAAALGEEADNIAAIGFTGQMAGFMGVDQDWNDITGWSCSLDTRYTLFAQKQMERFGDDFYRISGTNSPLFSSKYAWFVHEYPEAAGHIAKYLMLNGYVIGKLGEMEIGDAVIDPSLLTWTGLADVRNVSWSETLCRELSIQRSALPHIVPSSAIVGRLGEHMAEVTGLPSGIPLVCGAGDKIAGCVGTGTMEPGDMLFEAASFGAVSCRTDCFRPDLKGRTFDILDGPDACGRNPGRGSYYAHYYIPGSGITQEWFADQFCRKEGESLSETYARLDKQMSGIRPGSDGLYACGMLGGTVMPFNQNVRGAFAGFSWIHTPAHFYRALVESFACALHEAIEGVNRMYPEYRQRKQIMMIGGGSRQDAAAQIYCDVLDVPVCTIDREEPALWGACLLAAKGIGLIADVKEYAKARVHVRERFEPDPDRVEQYRRLKEEYRANLRQATQLCEGI